MTASKPYVVIVELSLKPNASILEGKKLLVQNSAASFQNEPGCFRFDVVETHNDETTFFLYEIYQDEKAFSEHLKSKHYLEFEVASEQFFYDKKIRLGGLLAEGSDAIETQENE